MIFHITLFLYLLTAWTMIQAQPLRVAATVKPLHSLVAGVMEGAGQPELVLTGSESPHHYSLRPSERRTLGDATLVFWIGPQFETFLSRMMEDHAGQRHIALIETAGLETLPARTADVADESDAHPDPHIWLSVNNARVMIDEIAKQLIDLDPGQQQLYQRNRDAMLARLDALDQELHTQLDDLHSPFLTFHDAFQYFEHDYRLHNAGFVNNSEELPPGAHHVHELIELIDREHIGCLFYDAPTQPVLVKTLQRGHNLDAVELDPLGLRLHPGTGLWFTLMRNIASGFAGCLHTQTENR
jgi:zinc transport system substrate-binding protein